MTKKQWYGGWPWRKPARAPAQAPETATAAAPAPATELVPEHKSTQSSTALHLFSLKTPTLWA